MPHIRRALSRYALPIGAAGVLIAPAVSVGAPATFAPPADYELTINTAQQLGVADFNGDGKLDVAAGAWTHNNFAVLPGNGDGTLDDPIYTTVLDPDEGVSLPQRVNVADLNSDGKPDLVFAGYGINANDIIINTSSGGAFSFGAPLLVGDLLEAPQAPAESVVGDLNDDGKLDIVQTGYNGGNCTNGDAVLLRLGNGDGTFGASGQLFTSADHMACEGSQGAAIADVNGDGDLDVLALSNKETASSSLGSFLVGIGDGAGAVEQPAPRVLTGVDSPPKRIVMADLNGDDDPDVVTTSSSHGISTLLGNGDGTFDSPDVYPSMLSYGVAVGDVNGDGVQDLVVPDSADADSIKVALGDGDGTFAAPQTISLPAGHDPYGIALADLNGDGLNDIIVGKYHYPFNTGVLSVLINTTALAAPTVTSATPSTGSTIGGTTVTITGTGFGGATAVLFGGVAATSFTVNSSTSITAVIPAHAAGTVSIMVVTGGGTATGAGLFTYTEPATPGTGSEGATSSGQSGSGTRTPAGGAVQRLQAIYKLNGLNLRSTGPVPAGADQIVVTAVRGSSNASRRSVRALSNALVRRPCKISTSVGQRTFTCVLRLQPGPWTVTTGALTGRVTIAKSAVRVQVKAPKRVPVTG